MLITYLLTILKLALYSIAIILPTILLPLGDPADGFSVSNFTYFAVYNGVVCTYFAMASWRRLARFCYRKKSRDGMEPFTIEWNGMKDPRVRTALIMVYLVPGFAFSFSGAFAGANLERCYHMLYMAPPVLISFDFIFYFLFLPKQEQNWKSFRLFFVYSNGCLLPIILLFIPVVIKIMIKSPWVDVVLSIIVIPSLRYGCICAMSGLMKHEMENCGFDGDPDSVYLLHLNLVIEMGMMMMFPGADDYIILYAILLLSIGLKVSELMELLTDYASIKHLPETEQRTHLTLVGKMANHAISQHLASLATPPVFLVIFTILFYAWNTQYYFVYSCFTEETFIMSVYFTMIYWALTVILWATEMAVIAYVLPTAVYASFTEAIMMRLSKSGFSSALGISSIVAFFVSCFYIKHDGLEILDQLGEDACS